MWSDLPFYDRFAKVREAGFTHVEFGGWTDLVFSRVSELLRQHELKLASISGARNHSLLDSRAQDDFLEFVSQTIAVCKNFACRHIVVASEADAREAILADKDDKSAFAKIAAATRAFTEAAQMAEKTGITLLVKSRGEPSPEGRARGIPSAGEVVRIVNSPALRVLYEAKRGDEPDGNAAATLRKYRDVIRYVQVTGDDAPPPHAANDLARIRTLLARELDYDGIVGFALRTGGDESRRLEEIRNF